MGPQPPVACDADAEVKLRAGTPTVATWCRADTHPRRLPWTTLLVSIEPIFLRPGPERVLSVVAELTGVPVAALLGPSRTRPVSHARKLAMYLLRTEAGLSHAQVGRCSGAVASRSSP